jgi:hypothetical protein
MTGGVGGGGVIPDGEEKLVLTRFLISICACCTSSVTSSRLRNSELVTCITTIIVKDLKHQLLVRITQMGSKEN